VSENRPGADLREAAQRKGSFVQTLRAVGWSFFGVRKGSEYEKDVARLNPVHVVVAGVLGAIVFILLLVALVNWVIGSGVAAG
jgi:hypothetical protein